MSCRRANRATTRAGAWAAGHWTARPTTGSRRTTPTWLGLSHRLRDPSWFVHAWGLDAERVRQPHEEVEQRGVVGGLRDLLIAPPHVAQPLHLLIGDPVCPGRDGPDELEQHPLGRL